MTAAAVLAMLPGATLTVAPAAWWVINWLRRLLA